jgi:hypothetical protein
VPPISTKVHALLRCSFAPLSLMVQDSLLIVDHSVLVLKKYRKEEEAKQQDALVINKRLQRKQTGCLWPLCPQFPVQVFFAVPIHKFVFIS